MTDFQEVIAKLEERGWSKGRIAEKIGCSRPAIYAWAQGKNKQPGYDFGAALLDLERRTRR